MQIREKSRQLALLFLKNLLLEEAKQSYWKLDDYFPTFDDKQNP